MFSNRSATDSWLTGLFQDPNAVAIRISGTSQFETLTKTASSVRHFCQNKYQEIWKWPAMPSILACITSLPQCMATTMILSRYFQRIMRAWFLMRIVLRRQFLSQAEHADNNYVEGIFIYHQLPTVIQISVLRGSSSQTAMLPHIKLVTL